MNHSGHARLHGVCICHGVSHLAFCSMHEHDGMDWSCTVSGRDGGSGSHGGGDGSDGGSGSHATVMVIWRLGCLVLMYILKIYGEIIPELQLFF